MSDKNDLIRGQLESRLTFRKATAAQLQRFHAAEKRRGEFTNRQDIHYVPLAPNADLLTIRQAEAAIATPLSVFSHVATAGMGTCVGIAIIAHASEQSSVGVAMAHVDSNHSAAKTVGLMLQSLRVLPGCTHFTAALVTGNLDAALMNDAALALECHGITPKIDSTASAIAVNIRTGKLIDPHDIKIRVSPVQQHQIQAAPRYLPESQPPATIIFDNAAGNVMPYPSLLVAHPARVRPRKFPTL